jgi:hypothetical protein
MSEQPKDDKHWEQYRKPKESKMKFDLKNILIGVVIGIISTTSVFFLIGDVEIETEIQLGEKANQDNKDIQITIEKNIDENGEEIINVSAIGKGSVTKKDIEKELEKVFAEKNIDASSGIEVNITLDDENSFNN